MHISREECVRDAVALLHSSLTISVAAFRRLPGPMEAQQFTELLRSSLMARLHMPIRWCRKNADDLMRFETLPLR